MSDHRHKIRCVVLALIALSIPFLTERVIMNERIFFLKVPFQFSKETWFAFYGSYFGALATIVLSYVALRQNKEYKRLSDQSAEAYYDLQAQVKDLTAEMMKALEVLKRVEVSKYWPALMSQSWHSCNMSRDRVLDLMQEHDCAVQATVLDRYDMVVDPLQLFDEHRSSYAVLLKNAGEKTIRSFQCDGVEINGQFKNMHSFATDVSPGQLVLVAVINVPEWPAKNEVIHVEARLSMQNLLGEQFRCVVEMTVHEFDGVPFINSTLTPSETCSRQEEAGDVGDACL